jgi:hypothetical protein
MVPQPEEEEQIKKTLGFASGIISQVGGAL